MSKKITVKHYLNKNLRPSEIKGELTFPVYIRVSFGRKNERIPSCWIPHSQSERAIENDKIIIDLINYEKDAIEKGIELLDYNENIRVRSLLIQMLDSFSDNCIGGIFDKDEVIKQIIEFIHIKTNLSKEILDPFIRLKEWDFNEIYELSRNNIFDSTLDIQMLYYGMLLEFRSIYYNKKTNFGYIVDCYLTNYDWLYRKGKERFVEYAVNKKHIPKKNIISLSNELTEKVIDNIKFWSSMNIDKRF